MVQEKQYYSKKIMKVEKKKKRLLRECIIKLTIEVKVIRGIEG